MNIRTPFSTGTFPRLFFQGARVVRLSGLAASLRKTTIWRTYKTAADEKPGYDWRPTKNDVYGPQLFQPVPLASSYVPPFDESEIAPEPAMVLDLDMPTEAEFQRKLDLFNPHKPRPKPIRIDPVTGRSYGFGYRKTASAKAWVGHGTGKFMINGERNLLEYFQIPSERDMVLQPFVGTETIGLFDTWVTVRGGGHRAQADASRQAIANALGYWDDGLRAPLTFAGIYKRDLRQVERKKPGQAKARKKFQWVKR